eukprot:Nitzschia sp. Nitz4//scaffold216_size36101//17056//17784//NITZ4_007779-RA/size36101-processed-gene-0.44-mRNA-1//-1//CDS//3329542188//2278//frame0
MTATSTQRWSHCYYVVIMALFLVSVIFVVLTLGEEEERKIWAAAPSTMAFYTVSDVCLHEESGNVLNCGHCGSCSNLNDIRVYHETRHTLTDMMTGCAKRNWLLGQNTFDCIKSRAGMTDDCSTCWVQNYECNIQNCVRTCLKQRFFPFLPTLSPWNSEPLDPCIACDEKLCGPDFIQCAGANRRRVGVISDIERDHGREICTKVDWDWIHGENGDFIDPAGTPLAEDRLSSQGDLSGTAEF